MPSESKVCFFFPAGRVTLLHRHRLKKYIVSIFRAEGKKIKSLNYIFCSDRALLDINRQFLSHDFYTDIITFDLSETGEINAEIYISVDRVRENARKLEVSIQSELHRVIFHGVLHLCGYGDKTGSEKSKMRKGEEFYLTRYFKKRST